MKRIRQHRSVIPNTRPATPYEGQLYVNFADMQLGVVNNGNTPVDLIPIRFHSPLTAYAVGEIVVQSTKLWRAVVANGPKIFDQADWEEAGGMGTNAIYRQTQAWNQPPVGTATFTWSHDPIQLEVYLNGSRLVHGIDYTADGTTITLAIPTVAATDIVEAVSYQSLPVTQGITQAFADGRYLQITGNPLLQFTAARAYNQDELVWINGNVWRAKTAITPGPWNPTQWAQVGVGSTRQQQRWIATANQTVFNWTHNAQDVDVILNGAVLDPTTDYTADGSTITLTYGADVGDVVRAVTRI